jgi:hypothetical protein
MNKRIQQLAEQATSYNNSDGWLFDKEKFAQLIVQECMDAVGDGPMQRPEIQRIKARFGVEYYEPIEKAFGS